LFKIFILIIALGIVHLFSGTGLAQSQKDVPAKVTEEKPSAATGPTEEFQKARESFLKKDLKASAAAYFMKLQVQVEEKREQTFFASQEGLSKLAAMVEKGVVKSAQELDRAFVDAFHVLAEYHYWKALESWAKEETMKAGQELEAASAYLARGIEQAEGKMKSGVRSVIEESHLLAGKLMQGGGWAKAEAEKQIQALGGEIENLGKKLKAPKK
jgi:hypothetical protein